MYRLWSKPIQMKKLQICESKFKLPECQLIRLLRSGLIWLVKMLITNCSNIGGLVGLMVSWSTGWWWYERPALQWLWWWWWWWYGGPPLQWWAIVWKAVGLFVVGRIFDSVVPHTLSYPQFKPTFFRRGILWLKTILWPQIYCFRIETRFTFLVAKNVASNFCKR